MNYETAVSILGLKEPWNEQDLRIRYRKLAKRFHPDKNIGKQDISIEFHLIKDAYDFLNLYRDTQNKSNSKDLLNGDFYNLIGSLISKYPAGLHRISTALTNLLDVSIDVFNEYKEVYYKKSDTFSRINITVPLLHVLKDDMYVLTHNENTVHVPLWAHASILTYELGGTKLEIDITIEEPDNVIIEDNNIIIVCLSDLDIEKDKEYCIEKMKLYRSPYCEKQELCIEYSWLDKIQKRCIKMKECGMRVWDEEEPMKETRCDIIGISINKNELIKSI